MQDLIRETAGCAGTDTTTFYSLDPEDIDLCRRICARCPVAAACLAGARRRDEQFGVWGGVVFTPRLASCSVAWNGRWFIRARDVFGVETTRGGFATKAAAEQRAAQLLEDSDRRVAAGARLRKSGHFATAA